MELLVPQIYDVKSVNSISGSNTGCVRVNASRSHCEMCGMLLFLLACTDVPMCVSTYPLTFMMCDCVECPQC